MSIDSDNQFWTGVWITLLLIICVSLLVELTIMGYHYSKADKVECSWWGCKTTEVREHSITINRTCTHNGHQVNCSKMDGDLEGNEIQDNRP